MGNIMLTIILKKTSNLQLLRSTTCKVRSRLNVFGDETSSSANRMTPSRDLLKLIEVIVLALMSNTLKTKRCTLRNGKRVFKCTEPN